MAWQVERGHCTQEQADLILAEAAKCAHADTLQQIRILIDGYIDYCGASEGISTLYYNAAEGYFYSMPDNKDDLLVCHLAELSPNYTSDLDDYDITNLSRSDMIKLTLAEIRCNPDHEQVQALCQGIILAFEQYDHTRFH